MPPLRTRPEDVPLLLDHYLKLFSEENGVPPLTIEPGAMRYLQAYAWPGNVREVRNFVENAVVLRRGGKLTEFDLDPKFRGEAPAAVAGVPTATLPAPLANPLSVEENERRLLREALVKARGNRTRAAETHGDQPPDLAPQTRTMAGARRDGPLALMHPSATGPDRLIGSASLRLANSPVRDRRYFWLRHQWRWETFGLAP